MGVGASRTIGLQMCGGGGNHDGVVIDRDSIHPDCEAIATLVVVGIIVGGIIVGGGKAANDAIVVGNIQPVIVDCRRGQE